MPTANLFAEKGFDNVFLLSGGITFLGNPGIEQFLQNYPELVEGKRVPILPKIECIAFY
jgi:centrosomal protein CEP41